MVCVCSILPCCWLKVGTCISNLRTGDPGSGVLNGGVGKVIDAAYSYLSLIVVSFKLRLLNVRFGDLISIVFAIPEMEGNANFNFRF